MKVGKLIAWGFTAVLLVLAGCKSGNGLQKANTAYWYQASQLVVRPFFVTRQLNDTSALVHYRINTRDLLYIRRSNSEAYEAAGSIRYELLPSIDKLTALDSGQVTLNDRADAPRQVVLTGEFKLRLPQVDQPQRWLLRLQVMDEYRNAKFEYFENIVVGHPDAPVNYHLQSPEGLTLYQPHVPPQVPVKISHRQEPERIWVGRYDREFPMALPPYANAGEETFELTPDSIYPLWPGQPFQLPGKGFYHFRTDTSQWGGFTLFSYYAEFPYIARRENLAGPLRYLTTQSEWEELSSLRSKPAKVKLWTDEFWLKRAGSKERARQLIEAYYGRVEFANRYFSSFLEGWKTDRGIIYIIYGPPDKVFTSIDGEEWVYGNESSSLPYIFRFSKVSNPFTENDYELQRSQSYRYGWGQAISSWRSGHAYNSQDIKREQNEQDQFQYNTRYPVWY